MSSQAPTSLPALDGLMDRYERDGQYREYAQHNHNFWRWVNGGLALMRKSPLSFDPVQDYWFCTERRLLVAFFAEYFHQSYVPVAAMRSLAHRVFVHFDQARSDGRFGDRQLATRQSGLWPDILGPIADAAEGLPELDEYGELRKIWGRTLKPTSFRKLFVDYLDGARDRETPGAMEQSLFTRLPWFPYLGLRDRAELLDHQRFFFGLYQTFASTNSYMLGGAMNMAPVLQNNPTSLLLGYIEQWANGETPHATEFVVEGRSERKNRSHHAPVVELYGFLNLHRVPFQNQVTAKIYQSFAREDDASIFGGLERVGEETRGWLEGHSDQVEPLANLFRGLSDDPPGEPKLRMEGIRRARLVEKYPEEAAKVADRVLVDEIGEAARRRAGQLSDSDAATAMLHILIDASIYTERKAKPDPDPVIPPPIPPKIEPIEAGTRIQLPVALRSVANDALGYLQAGHHVLFAGPPGTGKTTIAQFVGHAWNHERQDVADEILLSAAPLTTVGNSAWSPFHTIGGILPDEGGRFASAKGIFIDPDSADGEEWSLRPDCLVIDELNRADLDRCIGELYPLLSRSVDRVQPAGIPGVASIRMNPRFRLVATVNDASLDDVVFPISEGLARRFLRLELYGATSDDLESFLETDAEDRSKAVRQVVETMFDACRELGKLQITELGEHLPFGVGYFATLRDWCHERLRLSQEFSERDLGEQALVVLLTSLRSAVRVRGMEDLMEKVRVSDEES